MDGAAALSSPVHFAFDGWRAVQAGPGDIARVQRFFEANPEYLALCEGRGPCDTEGREFVEERPPAQWAVREQLNLLLVGSGNEVDGVLAVAVDFLAPEVWHLGLMIIATRLHGSGLAQRTHAAYEQWARARGARWLRLAVAAQNERALRFWQRQGYVELRRREQVEMGALHNTVLVLCKPIEGTL